jgi:hypothetical protein
MRVDVNFPESRSTGPLSTYQFDIGHSLIDPVKRGEPIVLAPDATWGGPILVDSSVA